MLNLREKLFDRIALLSVSKVALFPYAMDSVAAFLQPSEHLDNLRSLVEYNRDGCLRAANDELLPEHVRRNAAWLASCYEVELRLLRGETVEG